MLFSVALLLACSASDRIQSDEGCRLDPYTDTTGNATVGYGHRLTTEEPRRHYTMAEVAMLFDHDFRRACADAASLVPGLATYPSNCKLVLQSMAFQLGRSGLNRFKRMLAAVRDRDYVTASREMLRSKWAQQCPYRAEALAELMRGCNDDDRMSGK